MELHFVRSIKNNMIGWSNLVTQCEIPPGVRCDKPQLLIKLLWVVDRIQLNNFGLHRWSGIIRALWLTGLVDWENRRWKPVFEPPTIRVASRFFQGTISGKWWSLKIWLSWRCTAQVKGLRMRSWRSSEPISLITPWQLIGGVASCRGTCSPCCWVVRCGCGSYCCWWCCSLVGGAAVLASELFGELTRQAIEKGCAELAYPAVPKY